MIGASLHQDSRARSSIVRFLALFLGLSLITHGLYYPQEWLLEGFVLSAYIISSCLRRRLDFITEEYSSDIQTDLLLLGFLLLSLLGFFHPVRFSDGLLEALRWGIFWFVYRLGFRVSFDDTAKKYLIKCIEWLAMTIAIIGWLPWVSKVAGRLSSVFGYPNAAAAFLGAVLLLNPHSKLVRFFLVISLLGTGSRAGVGLFLIVLGAQQLLLRADFQEVRPSLLLNRKLGSIKILSKYRKEISVSLVGIVGIILMPRYYKSAWENLTVWGFTSSSWQERLVYFKDGISLAWNTGGLPQAGGWWAFPTVQSFPYWTADPHSSIIHILLNQGIIGVIGAGIWGIFSLKKTCKTREKNKRLIVSVVEREEAKAQLKVYSALLFLGLHSLVDADFSFGALGVLFWLLFGTYHKANDWTRGIYSKPYKLLQKLNKIGTLGLSIIFCLVCGGGLLNPNLLEQEKIWNMQAAQSSEQDSEKNVTLLRKSLKWDQTQVKVRQELAEQLLRQGNLNLGLEAVQEVLYWQPFEIKAYEWAQSVVWDSAEMSRQAQPESTMILYRWVENVPKIIEGKMVNLSSLDRKLWQGHRNFQPTEHIKLLADNARQRQLTQLLPQHKL